MSKSGMLEMMYTSKRTADQAKVKKIRLVNSFPTNPIFSADPKLFSQKERERGRERGGGIGSR